MVFEASRLRHQLATNAVVKKRGRATSMSKDSTRSESSDHRAPERITLRLHPDAKARVAYWADSQGVSVNEFIVDAIDAAIRRMNSDYDLPTLEIARLAQLLDETKALTLNVANLERVITQMADSLLNMTRGDNYLLDTEDGELP